jgi:predicted metal-dependent phosphoesterase TrpH
LLCYFIEPGDGPLQESLVTMQRERETRNRAMTEKLNSIGVTISYDEVVDEAGGRGVGRPHFAAVLIRHGYAESMEDAFERWLGEGQPGHLEKRAPGPAEVIRLTRESGGVVSIAHPTTLLLEGAELHRALQELADMGLTGVECHYSSYPQELRNELAAMSTEIGLVPTGGSDYHGTYKPELFVGIGNGDLKVPNAVLTELKERLP